MGPLAVIKSKTNLVFIRICSREFWLLKSCSDIAMLPTKVEKKMTSNLAWCVCADNLQSLFLRLDHPGLLNRQPEIKHGAVRFFSTASARDLMSSLLRFT
jgi:hypothetical protein